MRWNRSSQTAQCDPSLTSAALPSILRGTTPLDLEAGNSVWAIKRIRGYLWCTTLRIFSDRKALETICKAGVTIR